MTLPRPPLGGRYSLERPLLSSGTEQHWMAIEVATGRLVVLAICEAGRLASLSAARGVTHRHLTSIVDVMREVPPGAFTDRVKVPAGACIALAEHVPGRSLRAVLADGPLHVAKAVAWTLRLADAVQALHAVGAVHGAISPRSVLAAPEGRPIAPVLSQLVAPPIGAFCPPERLRGAAETATDDVWALYATLYAALTGKAPFSATTREGLLKVMSSRPTPLSEFGVEEPALQEILARGLAADRRARMADLSELVAALDGWERDPKMLPPPSPPPRPSPKGLGEIAGGMAFASSRDDQIVVDDSALPDDQGRSGDFPEDEQPTTFARLPASVEALAAAAGTLPLGAPAAAPKPQVPAVPKRPSINPFERKGNLVPWLLGAAILGGGVVYLAVAPGAKTDAKPAAEPTPSREPAPAKAPVPAAKKDPELARNECVVSHFEEDAFDAKADFAFVCADGDFRETAGRLHAMVKVHEVADAAARDAASPDAALAVDTVRPGTKALDGGAPASLLGWYELPATAIIRKACCPDSAPITLPETPGWCEQLQTVVRRMANDSAKSVDLAPIGRTFDKAVGCLFAQRIRHGYTYDKPPTPANRSGFQQFLGRAAISSARR